MKKILLVVWNYEKVKEVAKYHNLSVTTFINICINKYIKQYF